MVKKRSLTPLPIFDQKALPAFLNEHGYKELHAITIWRYLAQHPTALFSEIPKLSPKLRVLLEEHFVRYTTTIVTKQVSIDGTVKLLLALQDGHEIEAVIMKHTGRNTLCVSSQVGCQMGCTFCATGTMGIIADLWSGEILEQLAYANTIAPIRNVVFMGMGEPLNNYDAVLAAINAMTSVFGLAPRHITLSTVGVIHRIRQLNKDAPLVRLALSLHAPTQEMRAKIVPTSTAYPLDKLMDAIDEHLAQKGNRLVMMEYCMLAGVNDAPDTAHLLGKLLSGKEVHVNLIPYNATDVDAEFQSPSPEVISTFHGILRDEYKLKATIRENHGMDIDGACGQLAVKSTNDKADIEDIGKKMKSEKRGAKLNTALGTKSASKLDYDNHGFGRRLDTYLAPHYTKLGITLLSVSIVCLTISAYRRYK